MGWINDPGVRRCSTERAPPELIGGRHIADPARQLTTVGLQYPADRPLTVLLVGRIASPKRQPLFGGLCGEAVSNLKRGDLIVVLFRRRPHRRGPSELRDRQIAGRVRDGVHGYRLSVRVSRMPEAIEGEPLAVETVSLGMCTDWLDSGNGCSLRGNVQRRRLANVFALVCGDWYSLSVGSGESHPSLQFCQRHGWVSEAL